jgi:hypothetical protein
MRLSTGSYSFHRLLEATRIALRQAPAPQRASPRDFALRIALRKAPVPQRASTRSSECPYFGDRGSRF